MTTAAASATGGPAARLEEPGGGVHLTLHDAEGDRRLGWSDVPELDWSDFGLVLGAGGATGLSFEAGCLLALSIDHRIDVRGAREMVGTSAGSIVGSLIALGFDAVDLAALVMDVPQHIDPAVASMEVHFDDELPEVPHLLHLFRRPTISTTVTGIGLMMRRRFSGMLANALRHGEFDLGPQLRALDGVDWPRPDNRLRICATHSSTGGRRAWSASSGVPLSDAVAASCAVPGVMRPVMVGGAAHVDGGVVSASNADVLSDFDGTLIVVVSPMSGRRSTSPIGRVTSAHARRRLGSEVRRLRRHRPVLVIEPSDALSAMVVDAALDTRRTSSILRAAFLGSSLNT